MIQEPIYNHPVDICDLSSHDATSGPIINYSEILDKYGKEYTKTGKYLTVGNINWIQGWILDLTATKHKVVDMLECVLPYLSLTKIPFKLVRNVEVAGETLLGSLGYVNHAKILSVYTYDNRQAREIAIRLIELTSSFKGPEILTDRYLGGLVYTRYGACRPIIRVTSNGMSEKCIYAHNGALIKDPISIPFALPSGVEWPFDGISSPRPPKKETILQDRYKPMFILKDDTKGTVKKGLRLHNFFKINWCVLKEGRHCMLDDRWGRDVSDRLRWQFQLQNDLAGRIPLPKAYDLFQENDNTYLIMEFIKGRPLTSIISDILKGKAWGTHSLQDRMLVLDYALQLLNIIDIMHAIGYIHRDITPNNFLVDREQRLWLIDLELCYSSLLKHPTPPFTLGTPGYMSPEQELIGIPTIKEDIYAIGAILFFILTGLSPEALNTNNTEMLDDQLAYFVPDGELATMLTVCLSHEPDNRPNIPSVKTALNNFRNKQVSAPVPAINRQIKYQVDRSKLKEFIHYAIIGFSNSSLLDNENLWVSKTIEEEDLTYSQSMSTSVYSGFYQGVGGVIYTLSKAHQATLSIDHCLSAYNNGLKYIRANNSNQFAQGTGALHNGTAGIALALIASINCGLIQKDSTIMADITQCLSNSNMDGCSIAKGLAGKGLALLAAEYTSPTFDKNELQNIVSRILENQQKDGSWSTETHNTKKSIKATGLAYGVSGIICFLAQYLRTYSDISVIQALAKALQWLLGQSISKNGKVLWLINDRGKDVDWGSLHGIPGVALAFIKAYEAMQEPLYKETATKLLYTLPENPILPDLTLGAGLSGLGELYLEAAKVLHQEEWETRAQNIAQFIIHYSIQQKDGSLIWQTDGSPVLTADLIKGNAGILHFLIRTLDSNLLSHPLLPS